MDILTQVYNKAIEYANKHYPQASQSHKTSFAYSVAYYVTGIFAGSPTIREHLCSWMLAGDGDISTIETSVNGSNYQPMTIIFPDGRLPRAGDWKFDRAVEVCSSICFGQLSRLALKVVVQEYYFDDDPNDLALIKQWELEELTNLKQQRKLGKLKQKDYLRMKWLMNKHS